MAIKIHFSSLSLGASVDQQTGSLSVFDVVEEIRTPQLPIQIHALVISLAMEKKDQAEFTGKIVIHFFTPDGKQQPVGTGDMRIPADQKRMKAVFRFGGFPIQSFGEHRFVLSCLNQSGVKIAESILDFQVLQVTQVAQGIPSDDKPSLAH